MTTEQMDWLDDEHAGRHRPPVQGEQPKGGAGNSGTDTGYTSFNVDPAQIQRDLDGIDNSSVIQVTAGALRVLAQRAARVPAEPAYFDGEGDDPVSETWTGQVEEPIEDRLQRAFVNGFVEGIRRVSYGLPWDHSS